MYLAGYLTEVFAFEASQKQALLMGQSYPLDYMLLKIEDSRIGNNEIAYRECTTLTTFDALSNTTELVMIGRASGRRTGRYNAVLADVRGFQRFPGVTFALHTIIGERGTDFNLPGDSGSLMRDEASNMVWMIFANGNFLDDPRLKIGFAHELKSLLDHVKEEFGLSLEPIG